MAPEMRIKITDILAGDQLRALVTRTEGLELIEETALPEEIAEERQRANIILPGDNIEVQPESLQEEWREQTAEIRPLVAALRQPAAAILDAVNANVEILIQEAFKGNYRYEVKKAFDRDVARNVIANVFQNSLPENIPKGYVLRNREGKKHFIPKSGLEVLVPSHINILIKRYGLVTGTQKDPLQLANEQNVRYPTMLSQILNASKKLATIRDILAVVAVDKKRSY